VSRGDLDAFRRDVARWRAGGPFGATVRATALRIVRDVRRHGDDAVLAGVRRFDRAAARGADLVVEPAAIRRAAKSCPAELRRALDLAHRRISAFHETQRPRPARRIDAEAVVELLPLPLRRVGALVPRGAVSYPSTALMTGVPARVAGVRELVIASPMPPDGSLDPGLAYAATLVRAAAIYRAGGAAAVAALAYGTRRLERVDKIVGPGNSFAAAAKWLVSADVGRDAIAGPSELVVVATRDADAAALVLDLLAQAEHGAGAFAALISDDGALLDAVATLLRRIAGRTRIGCYRAPSALAAVRAADDAAPEHVLLAGARAAALREHVRRAGALFVGARSAVAFGDYVAGSNHSLPTGGTAQWSSALRVDDFVRWQTRVRVVRGRRLAAAAATVARYERMRYHAASVEIRT
jgi:histidinol dehydrogenase